MDSIRIHCCGRDRSNTLWSRETVGERRSSRPFFPEPEQLLGPLSPYSQGRAAGNPFDSPRRIHGDNQRVCGH